MVAAGELSQVDEGDQEQLLQPKANQGASFMLRDARMGASGDCLYLNMSEEDVKMRGVAENPD